MLFHRPPGVKQRQKSLPKPNYRSQQQRYSQSFNPMQRRIEKPQYPPNQTIMSHIGHKKQKDPIVGGSNTSQQNFLVGAVGTAGGSLWTLNTSTMPMDHRRSLTLKAAQYLLINYGSADFPTILYLKCAQLSGVTLEDGNQGGVIGLLMANGPPIPVYNSGGVIGYSILYTLVDKTITFDVTGIPSLTFDLALNHTGPSIAYPLNDPLGMSLTLNHINI